MERSFIFWSDLFFWFVFFWFDPKSPPQKRALLFFFWSVFFWSAPKQRLQTKSDVAFFLLERVFLFEAFLKSVSKKRILPFFCSDFFFEAFPQSDLFMWPRSQTDLFIFGPLTITSVHIGMPAIRSVYVWPSHKQICSYAHAHNQIWDISCVFTIKSFHMGMFKIRSVHDWPSHNQICSYGHAHNQICSYQVFWSKSVHMGMPTIRFVHVWPSHNQICPYAHAHNQICSYLALSQSNLFILACPQSDLVISGALFFFFKRFSFF